MYISQKASFIISNNALLKKIDHGSKEVNNQTSNNKNENPVAKQFFERMLFATKSTPNLSFKKTNSTTDLNIINQSLSYSVPKDNASYTGDPLSTTVNHKIKLKYYYQKKLSDTDQKKHRLKGIFSFKAKLHLCTDGVKTDEQIKNNLEKKIKKQKHINNKIEKAFVNKMKASINERISLSEKLENIKDRLSALPGNLKPEERKQLEAKKKSIENKITNLKKELNNLENKWKKQEAKLIKLKQIQNHNHLQYLINKENKEIKRLERKKQRLIRIKTKFKKLKHAIKNKIDAKLKEIEEKLNLRKPILAKKLEEFKKLDNELKQTEVFLINKYKEFLEIKTEIKRLKEMQKSNLSAEKKKELDTRIEKKESKLNILKSEIQELRQLNEFKTNGISKTDKNAKYHDKYHLNGLAFGLGSGKKATFPNPTKIPYVVLPMKHKFSPMPQKGDLVLVQYTHKNGKTTSTYAIYGEAGPSNKIGEGSIKLFKNLGVSTDEGVDTAKVRYTFLSGSGKKHGITSKSIPTLTNKEIQQKGKEAFKEAAKLKLINKKD